MSLGQTLPWKNLGRWTVGVNNVDNPGNLSDREVVTGNNIDIDNLGQASLRKGKTLLLAGVYKWIWSDGDICLALYGNSLVSINKNFSGHQVIYTGLATGNRLSYVKVLDKIYYTNSQVLRYIQDGVDHAIPTPTEPFKELMIPGEFLEYHAGRLWVGKGNQLWPSDVLSVGQRDSRVGPKQFDGYMTLLKAVKNGLFVADEHKTYFLGIKDPTEMVPDALKTVAFYGAIPHAVTRVDGALVSQSKTIPGTVLFWASRKGVCVGDDNGEFSNVTMQRYEMPSAYEGSALHRINHQGTSQVIMTITN